MKFRLFNPKINSTSRMDLFASKIAGGIRYVQVYWAEAMSKLARKASLKTQWIFFILFLVGSICNCSWLIYDSISKQSPLLSKPTMERPIIVRPSMDLDTAWFNQARKKMDVQQNDEDSIAIKCWLESVNPEILPTPSKLPSINNENSKIKNNEKSIKE